MNGTLAGPLLIRLGLAKPTETRVRVVRRFEKVYYTKMLDDFVHLLADPRFASVDFAVIRHHVPELEDLTVEELREAVERNKHTVPPAQYKPPTLKNVLSYLEDGNATWSDELGDVATEMSSLPDIGLEDIDETKPTDEDKNEESMKLLTELRLAFLDMVRASFEKQVEKGELDSRQESGALYFALIQSCDWAADQVIRGHELAGWEATAIAKLSWIDQIDLKARRLLRPKANAYKFSERGNSAGFRELRFDVLRALSFVDAHRRAQERFAAETLEGEVDDAIVAQAKAVLKESEKQVSLAEDLLRSKDHEDVCVLISHLFAVILLNKVARDAERLQGNGILHEKEARKYLEAVENELHHIEFCAQRVHPGQHEGKREEDEQSPVYVMLQEMKSMSVRIRSSQIVVTRPDDM